MTVHLAVLISGRGSNLSAIQNNIEAKKLDATIELVISNKEGAPGLLFAQEHNLRTLICKTEGELFSALKPYPLDLICLAGYMKIISPQFIKAYPHKIINIHPSLLPKYPGLHVHERVLAAGEKESGCTVHYVDDGVDTGEIIAQRKVPVYPCDTSETLAARVLEQEHVLYSEVIQKFNK